MEKQTFIGDFLLQILRIFFFILALSFPAYGRLVDTSDIHFLFGYQAFLKKDFPVCISEFDQVLKTNVRRRLISKAGLFMAICRAKIGERKLAAHQAVRVKTKYLSSWDKRHFIRLKNYLNEDFNLALKERDAPKKAQYHLKYSVTPYGGQIFYHSPSQKKRAGFQGFIGDLSYHDWRVIVGMEKYTLRGRSFDGFSQTQGHLGVERKWNKTTLSGRYTNISSDSDSQDGINILGTGVSYRLFESTKLSGDLFYSHYPESLVGNLSVWQTNLALEQVILRGREVTFWLKAGIQQTNPNSTRISEGKTFIEEGYANRSHADFFVRFKPFTVSAGFWAGREIFGVRNNGLLVFSTPEEHLGGQSVSALWDVTNRIVLGLVWMNESIRIDNVDSDSRTTMGTFTYHFY